MIFFIKKRCPSPSVIIVHIKIQNRLLFVLNGGVSCVQFFSFNQINCVIRVYSAMAGKDKLEQISLAKPPNTRTIHLLFKQISIVSFFVKR